MKRKSDAVYIDNPFIKEANRTWSLERLTSLTRSVSPPPLLKSSRCESDYAKSAAALVEAGEKHVEDHLLFFKSNLSLFNRQKLTDSPRLDLNAWTDLYTTNASNHEGHHFVIHQHDHPVAGTHYDLRLQCNDTSSVSWAIMYGLPGDPNSRRLNRNATETRVHCLWNHLIETASHQTGTLLIWDTGTYEVLPYHDNSTRIDDNVTDGDNSEAESNMHTSSGWGSLSQPEKLHVSFQNRRVRLRLHGTRLPDGYTLSIWLRRENDRAEQPAAPKTRRSKGQPTHPGPALTHKASSGIGYLTEYEQDTDSKDGTRPVRMQRSVSSLHRHETPPPTSTTKASLATEFSARVPTDSSTPTKETEEELIRQTNAYIGATNSINSVHQRKWYLAMDRTNSGFVKQKDGRWIPRSEFDIQIPVHNQGQELSTQNNEISGSSMHRHKSNLSSSGSRYSRSGTDLSIAENVASAAAGAPPIRVRDLNTSTNEVSSSSIPTQRVLSPVPPGFKPFHVLGREHERSVVTGRLASDILADEGVVGYVSRGKWRAVVE